jgi:signal transduction histidine kinase
VKVQTEEPALTRRRVVRGLQLLTPLMLAWFVWAAAAAEPGFGPAGKPLIVALATGVFVAAVFGRNATAELPVRPAHVVSVASMLVSSVTLVVAQPGGPGSVAVLVAVLCAATRLMPVRVAVPVLIAAFVVLEMVASITGQDFGSMAALAGFAVLFGLLYLAFRLAEAQRRSERLLAELEAGQAALAEAAGLAERQRLAREMHDVLAHSLSGLLLQLEGARMLLAEDPTAAGLPVAVDRAHHLARTGLAEARAAIGMLRDDDLPGPDRLAALAAQFARDQAVPCDFAVSGEPHPLQSQARLALYRVAQEALTNVTKHASPTRVSLLLAYESTTTRLVVEDFAAGPPVVPDETDGYGLTGMRERAELLGGTLSAGATSHGFRVELVVPA